MFALIQHYGITLAICVALGAATAWWTLRGDRQPKKEEQKEP